MNSKPNDLKRKIAFTAALLMVSHTFAGMPCNNTTSALTVHAADSETTTASTAAGTTTAAISATGTTTSAVTNGTTTSTAASTTTTTTTTSTTTTATTTTAAKTEYTVRVVNSYLSEDDFRKFADKVFEGASPEVSIIEATESDEETKKYSAKIKVDPDKTPKVKIAVDDIRYRLKSNDEGEIEYDAYYIYINTANSSDKFTITADDNFLPDDRQYLKAGSRVKIKTKPEYKIKRTVDGIDGSDTADFFTVVTDGKVEINGGNNDQLTVKYKKKNKDLTEKYTVADKKFRIEKPDDILIYKKSFFESRNEFTWKEIDELSLCTWGKQRISLSDGTHSKTFTLEEKNGAKVLALSKLKDIEDFAYTDGINLKISATADKVNVKVFVDGKKITDDGSGNNIAYVNIPSSSESGDAVPYFTVPYIYKSATHLVSYKYNSSAVTGVSERDLKNEKLDINYVDNINDVELYYSTYNRADDNITYDFDSDSHLVKRNDNCYTLDKLKTRYTLYKLPDSSKGLWYSIYDKAAKDLKDIKGKPEGTDNIVQFDLSRNRNAGYVFIKNLLDGEDNYLDQNVCIYIDETKPELKLEKADTDWRNNKTGSNYTFSITDLEKAEFPNPKTIEQEEIENTFKDYINAETADHNEISAVLAGDYRFDRPAGGWKNAKNLAGRFETDAMREAEEKAVKELSTLVTALGEGFSGLPEDSYDSLKAELNSGCSNISTSIGNYQDYEKRRIDDQIAATEDDTEIASLETEKKELLTKIKELYNGSDEPNSKGLNEILASYNNTISAEMAKQASVDFVPTLSYADKKFTLNVKAKKADGIINGEKLIIRAVDNSRNISDQVENVNVTTIKVDGSAPVIDTENGISISGLNMTENENEYILKKDVVIDVDVTENGSGIDFVRCFIDGTETSSDKNSDGEMKRVSGKYRYIIPDLSDMTDKKVKLGFIAYDKAGNCSDGSVYSANGNAVSVSDKTVIIDTTAPECSISNDSSNPYEQNTENGKRNWYGAYSDIKLTVKANDLNPEICSGLKNIVITLNESDGGNSHDASKEFRVYKTETEDKTLVYAEPLAEGKYYLAFEASSADSSLFNAYLKRTDDDEVKIPVFENCRRGDYQNQNNNNNGSIRIKISAEDKADLKNIPSEGDNTETEVFVDLDDPEVTEVTVDYSDSVLYRKDTDNDGEKVSRFSHFSNTGFDINIRVNDSDPSSGLDHITVDLKNHDGSVYQNDYPTTHISDDLWRITVPMDFKGEIQVKAYDNVRKSSASVKSLGFITESPSTHHDTASVSIEMPQTNFRDRNGLPLYSSDDIKAKVTVKDTFSEIREVITGVKGRDDQHLYVGNDSSLSGAEADQWAVSKSDSDRNLVPELTREISGFDNANENEITVKMYDNAGNSDEENIGYHKFSIDTTDPVISCDFSDLSGSSDSENKNFFKYGRKAVFTVKERNFDRELTNILVNGAKQDLSWNLVKGTEGTDDAEYRAEIPFESDGVYKLTADCTDMGDRKSNELDFEEFVIDRTSPKMEVNFDQKVENGHFYNDTVLATFTVSETNFDPKRMQITGTYNNKAEEFPGLSSWVKQGDSYIATMRFTQNGDYTVNVTGSDKAGNTLTSYSSRFNIDKKAPEISVNDVKPANNSKEIRPRIVFTDSNLDKDSISITLNGVNRGDDLDFSGELVEIPDGYEYVFDNIPDKEVFDDIYTVKATVKDKAGNTSDRDYQFSVNRFGSTFMLDDSSQAIAGKYISKPQDIIIKEFNTDKHTGENTVVITRDNEMQKLEEGKGFTIEESGGDNEWKEYTYIIPSEVFDADGRYTVSVHTTDEAGNINISASPKKQAELQFYVDKTEPLCIPLNITDNGAYKGESHIARLSVSDNIMLKNAEVYINGNLTDSEFTQDECVFNIPNSKHTQLIKVILTDMAENKIEYVYKNILVTTNAVRFLAHKTWFRVAGGVTAAAAGAAVFFIRRRKKRSF
ncbi:MAG TPA: Ig-like domain repeat protein [Ruminococcus flavefaciens]|nr:Ig-like domain repeat protein [Ruminococcus flavefaciens]